MLQILIFTFLLSQVSTSQIHIYGNTTADYGGEAHYKCTMANSSGVHQVMWQRRFRDKPVNLATYSRRFGQQVNEPYRGKVILKEASLHSTSITLKNVSWQDESCYMCSFNVYPDGSKGMHACLTVKGISAVSTMHVPRAEHEIVFSCSAIGKPAPTIEWVYSPGATPLDHPETTTVKNGDHTFTSSSNITLQVPPDWSGHADCELNKGTEGERRERIPFSSRLERPDKKDNHGRLRTGLILVITALMVVSCILVANAVLKRKRLNDNRRTEEV